MPARRESALRWILVASIASTAAHYSHNFVEIERYPQASWISGGVIQALILVSWPLLTAVGLYGYRVYVRGRLRTAHACLVAYSFLGLLTPGHFLSGSPDIPAFWYATIFTDFIAGASIVAFVVWSATRPAPRRLRPSAPAR